MNTILGYLKPYALLIILAAGLLFLQANLELTLPDYMSRIINIGIQQSGIDDDLPEVISKKFLTKYSFLLRDRETEMVMSIYSPLSSDNTKYSKLLKKFPGIKKEETYVLKRLRKEEKQKLFQMVQTLRRILALEGLNIMKIENKEILGDSIINSITEFMPKEDYKLNMAVVKAIKAEYKRLGADIVSIQNSYVLKTGGIMILFTFISVIATIFVSLIAARSAAGIAMHVRSDVFGKVESFSSAEFDRFSTASLITRCTNDITQIQMLVFLLIRMAIYAPILGTGGVIRAYGKAPSMAWLIGLAVLLLLIQVITVMAIVLPRFRMIQKLIDVINRISREGLSGILVVRAFNRQLFEEKRFDDSNTDLTKVSLFVNRTMVVMMPLIMIVMNLLSAAIIWVGAEQIALSRLHVGDMMAFLQYTMQIVMSFMMLTMLFIFLPRSAVSASRISEVLNAEPLITDPRKPEKLLQETSGRIEFINVSFKYPGAYEAAVTGINFIAEPGNTTAIIGSTGSGKSTLVNLIPRFYDVSEGAIMIDGQDIRKLTQKDLRRQIGYVPQKAVLFSGSVRSNLKYSNEDASNQTVERAAETAQVTEFIKDKEEGFDYSIAQSGTNVSGGQKQRLSIARALVNNYPVLIFDDSFSAVDFKTDNALRKALKKNSLKSTIIIVAQRVSTIMNAEQIIVLDKGTIVGRGTHEELIKTCTEYQEIAMSQLDMKELT
jgi:ATP-binding cassette subfamily B protein